jgi:hypothetical protein
VYPSAVRRVSIFERSAVFLVSFEPTAPLVKSITGVVVVVVVVVVVLPVVVVLFAVVVVSVFLDFGDFVEVSALARVASTFVVLGAFTGFAAAPFEDGPCVVVEGAFADGPCVVVDGPCVVAVVFGP